MTAVGVRRFTAQEYYVLERAAEYKSDFYRGEIFARSGGTPRHGKIAVNVGGSLWQSLRGKPCQPYESNLRLRVLATGLRCYPDVSIFCKPFERDEESNGSWAVRDISGVASVAVIASVNVELPLSDIYDRVDFDARE